MNNKLWNKIKSTDFYEINKEKYHEHILEQYKLYVEMADRISARRNMANVFFFDFEYINFYWDSILSRKDGIIFTKNLPFSSISCFFHSLCCVVATSQII